jgi:hypothetical protein
MPNVPSPSGPRVQFSLRWLLILVTAVALTFGLTAVFGEGFLAGLIFVLYPTPLVVTIIYGSGDIRILAIGGVMPWATLIVLGAARGGDWMQLETIIWLFFLAALSGGLAILTKRWLERSGKKGHH